MEEYEEKSEYVLSDIHIENLPIEKHLHGSNKCISEITFILPIVGSTANQEFDEDGDIVIKRPEKHKFLIEHFLETSLNDVGLQLWKASLYLCDYLIANSGDIFHETTQVVELGAGIGLTSLVCSLFTNKIECTDLESIIKLAENNYKLNKTIIDNLRCNRPAIDIQFKTLDWSISEISNLEHANLFLAADVIYDDELTIKFLNILYKLMSNTKNQPKCAYIALEKRINFETTSLETTSSCYDYFEQSMLELNDYKTEEEEESIQFQTELLNLDRLPKYMINYDRSEYLMIWKVTSKSSKKN